MHDNIGTASILASKDFKMKSRHRPEMNISASVTDDALIMPKCSTPCLRREGARTVITSFCVEHERGEQYVCGVEGFFVSEMDIKVALCNAQRRSCKEEPHRSPSTL